MLKTKTDNAITDAAKEAVIAFTCEAGDIEVIAKPLPAKQAIPEWFRNIPAIDPEALSATNNGLTVKRCMPFLDALTLGWIMPLAATVRLGL